MDESDDSKEALMAPMAVELLGKAALTNGAAGHRGDFGGGVGVPALRRLMSLGLSFRRRMGSIWRIRNRVRCSAWRPRTTAHQLALVPLGGFAERDHPGTARVEVLG